MEIFSQEHVWNWSWYSITFRDVQLSLEGEPINTDTCNAAWYINALLSESVKNTVKDKFVTQGGVADIKPVWVLTQNHHHHICNVSIDAFIKRCQPN